MHPVAQNNQVVPGKDNIALETDSTHRIRRTGNLEFTGNRPLHKIPHAQGHDRRNIDLAKIHRAGDLRPLARLDLHILQGHKSLIFLENRLFEDNPLPAENHIQFHDFQPLQPVLGERPAPEP